MMSDKLDQEIKELEAGMKGTRAEGEGTGKSTDNTSEGQPSEKVEADSPKPEANQKQEPDKADPPKSDTLERADVWEHRFKQYKKSTDQTIYNLRQEVATLERKNLETKIEIDKAQAEVEVLKQQERIAERRSKLLSEDVVGIVGEDVARTLADTIDSSIAEEVGPLKKKLKEQREAKLEGARSAEEQQTEVANTHFQRSFKELIARNGFDFETINFDPNFVDGYLNNVDPITGVTYRDALDNAVQIKDAAGVAKIFVEYGLKVKADFSENVEPLGEGAGAPTTLTAASTEPEVEFVTKQEIDEFYENGYKSMTQKEIDAFEEKVVRCAENNQIR